MKNPVPLVIVHHANQFLLTNGYESREGLSAIAQGYASVLHFHDVHKIPFHLHLSGTLIEALAWGAPWVLTFAKNLRDQGLLEFIGGTYSENIMPCFNPEYNRRQILEYFQVFENHVERAESLKHFWVPERMWEPKTLSPLITDSSLPNGGYRGVFLDRRLLFPISGTSGLNRSAIDIEGPWTGNPASAKAFVENYLEKDRQQILESFRVHPMADEAGLNLLPIDEHLRYWIPPRVLQDYDRIEDLCNVLSAQEKSHLLIFADDLERTAGIAGWDSSALKRYEDFLGWLPRHPELLKAQLLTDALTQSVLGTELKVEAGTFYELAQKFRAGENYRGWSESHLNRETKITLDSAVQAVENAATETLQPALHDLAWKHVLAMGYETFWHEEIDHKTTLTPWARALASHSRHALVMLDAARWFGGDKHPLQIETRDIDSDGNAEIVLKNKHLYALITPQFGARLLFLFYRSSTGAAMMIGNPTDDWNFLSELNAYMEIPANHPGAACDTGGENDTYVVKSQTESPISVSVCLENSNSGEEWFGATKTFTLLTDSCALQITYNWPKKHQREMSFALSPDYLRLLREGRELLDVSVTDDSIVADNAGRSVSLRLASPEDGTLNAGGDIGHGVTGEFLGIGITQATFIIECREDLP